MPTPEEVAERIKEKNYGQSEVNNLGDDIADGFSAIGEELENVNDRVREESLSPSEEESQVSTNPWELLDDEVKGILEKEEARDLKRACEVVMLGYADIAHPKLGSVLESVVGRLHRLKLGKEPPEVPLNRLPREGLIEEYKDQNTEIEDCLERARNIGFSVIRTKHPNGLVSTGANGEFLTTLSTTLPPLLEEIGKLEEEREKEEREEKAEGEGKEKEEEEQEEAEEGS